MKKDLIIYAKFDPTNSKWVGVCIQMNVKGTHKNYNVVYNGDCVDEEYDTEEEAKQRAVFMYEENRVKGLCEVLKKVELN